VLRSAGRWREARAAEPASGARRSTAACGRTGGRCSRTRWSAPHRAAHAASWTPTASHIPTAYECPYWQDMVPRTTSLQCPNQWPLHGEVRISGVPGVRCLAPRHAMSFLRVDERARNWACPCASILSRGRARPQAACPAAAGRPVHARVLARRAWRAPRAERLHGAGLHTNVWRCVFAKKTSIFGLRPLKTKHFGASPSKNQAFLGFAH